MLETSKTDEDKIDLLIRSDADNQNSTLHSKKHTTLVRRMRLILPVLALCVIVVLITWKNEDAQVLPVPREQISPETVSQNELINPKFQSEDKDGQPYTITADKATQTAEDMNLLQLQKPVADVTLKSGGWISLSAKNGQYQQDNGKLALDGDIKIRHDSGYEMKTEKMNIDVKSQLITSDTPVTADGASGHISARGLRADGNSKILSFVGPVTLTLEKKKPEENPIKGDE